MKDLLLKLGDRVMGVLSGFDRLLFRGTLRCVINVRGMYGYLHGVGKTAKDFGKHAQQVSQRLKDASLAEARQSGRPVCYLQGHQDRKKDLALEIAERDNVQDGSICVLTCLEPCRTYFQRNAPSGDSWLEEKQGKCLHLYHYFNDPQFGLLHVRLQTWFPFTVQICLNGREWLCRQLEQAGIAYRRRDNCVSRVADLAAAQRLLDEQLTANWTDLLDGLLGRVHPAHEAIFAACPQHARGYYWSAAESEWASDVLFHNPGDVLPLAERWAAYSLRVHGAADVMRFLGRTPTAAGLPRPHFAGQIQSDCRLFEQGLRIKHRLNTNSVKLYNRPGVMRIETTINDPSQFKVWRTTEKDPQGQPAWLRLRKGVADLHRRAEVSQASNDRFATAGVSGLDEAVRLKELAASLCQRVIRPGRVMADGRRTKSRSFRALNPLSSEDVRLLTAVSSGQFVISGLRNADLRGLLYDGEAVDDRQKRQRSSAVSRKLALLRAHGILEKVSKSHRYRVTKKGRQALTALLAAANATTNELTKLAA